MKLLIDMNLPPLRVDTLTRHGWEAVHWSTVGDPHATDRTIMSWARERKYVVFTHDVDFGTLLAMTRAHGPSVIQVRTQNVMPAYLERLVTHALRRMRHNFPKACYSRWMREKRESGFFPSWD